MNKIITAIEITSSNIKLTQIDAGTDTIKLISIDEIIFNNPDELIPALKSLIQKYKANDSFVITTLPRYQAFLKKVTVPPGTITEIRNILQFEAERYLPFPLESAVIDCEPIKPLSSTQSNDVFLVAAKRETIDKHLEPFRAAGLIPDLIAPTSSAINSLVAKFHPAQEAYAIVYFTGDSWEIAIYAQGSLAISRGFTGKDIIENDDTIKNEISNTLNMFYASAKAQKIDCIYIISHSNQKEFIKDLCMKLNLPIVELYLTKLKENFSIPGNITLEQIHDFLIPIGLAMSAHQVNLLPADIKESITRKRSRKVQLIAAGIIILSFSLLTAAIFAIKYNKSSANRAMMLQIEQNKHEILELARIENQLNEINAFKANNMLPLEILKEISQTLPSNAYIRQFTYDNKENIINIRGRANSYALASKAISQLGKSKYFILLSNKGSFQTKVGDKDLVDFEVTCSANKEAINEKK